MCHFHCLHSISDHITRPCIFKQKHGTADLPYVILCFVWCIAKENHSGVTHIVHLFEIRKRKIKYQFHFETQTQLIFFVTVLCRYIYRYRQFCYFTSSTWYIGLKYFSWWFEIPDLDKREGHYMQWNDSYFGASICLYAHGCMQFTSVSYFL